MTFIKIYRRVANTSQTYFERTPFKSFIGYMMSHILLRIESPQNISYTHDIVQNDRDRLSKTKSGDFLETFDLMNIFQRKKNFRRMFC